jgi:hypothetical protein
MAYYLFCFSQPLRSQYYENDNIKIADMNMKQDSLLAFNILKTTTKILVIPSQNSLPRELQKTRI